LTLISHPEKEIVKNVIVNWSGSPLSNVDHPADVLLNGEAFTNKLRQALRLGIAGLPTVTVSLAKEGDNWYPRRNDHQQGFDFTSRHLRRGSIPADFYVKKEAINEEWRVHVFRSYKGNMRVLRTAKKVPNRPDAHSWVRSHRLGWKLSYVGGLSDAGKQIARDAVRALHLDFGAVDIGLRSEADPFVLEVNTCPGLEGGTLEMYATNILERATK
jgi:hypothetical protein